jgi:hypothetical protein
MTDDAAWRLARHVGGTGYGYGLTTPAIQQRVRRIAEFAFL